MYLFGMNNGCFVQANLPNSGARGVLISFGSGGGGQDFGSEAIVTGVGIAQKERLATLACFNDRNFIYAFGHDALASTVTIQALVSVSPTGAKALKRLTSWYQTGRASKGKLVTLSYGSMAMRGILVDMGSQSTNPALNLATVSYTLLLIKCIGE